LSEMVYSNSPHSLIELREAFSQAGLRKQEREVNYAIMHTEREKADFLDKTFFLAIEIPCDYGMATWRPIKILFGSTAVFCILYFFALKKQNDRAGIWKTWPEDRAPKDKSRENMKDALLTVHRGWRVWFALYFSLLSTFNVGLNEINISNWIMRMQPEEYVLKATGWVRFVSGVQSLIGVCMITLWLLSFFGHPIEF